MVREEKKWIKRETSAGESIAGTLTSSADIVEHITSVHARTSHLCVRVSR